jgi:hypothetical protein
MLITETLTLPMQNACSRCNADISVTVHFPATWQELNGAIPDSCPSCHYEFRMRDWGRMHTFICEQLNDLNERIVL